MAIKSVNLLLNNYCNNRCAMCLIWQNTTRQELSLGQIASLFSWPEFRSVDEVSVSGGEQLIRADVFDAIATVIETARNLKRLFVNTNGTSPERVRMLCERFVNRVGELFVMLSLEGRPDVNHRLRGHDTYKSVRSCLDIVAGKRPVRAIISTTIQRGNCTVEDVAHLMDLAEECQAGFTFRFADVSQNYYQNSACTTIVPTQAEKLRVLEYALGRRIDPFWNILKQFVLSGKYELMFAPDGALLCRAGDLFCFVRATGEIQPCLYSSRVIGTTATGITAPVCGDLGRFEPCPCCTECHVYPMLNYR